MFLILYRDVIEQATKIGSISVLYLWFSPISKNIYATEKNRIIDNENAKPPQT